MTFEDHDYVLSLTSHLPHAIAYSIVRTVVNNDDKFKDEIVQYSASGLRDFTRIAASDPIMWRDIFFSNKDNMIKSINKFIKNLNLIKKKIKANKDKELKKILMNSKKVRKQIIDSKQDVSKPDFGREI